MKRFGFKALPGLLIFLFLLVLTPLRPGPAAAQSGDPSTELDEVLQGFEDGDQATALDDVLSGFEDEAPEVNGEGRGSDYDEAETQGPSWWSLIGSLTLAASYNVAQKAPDPGQADYRGLSRLRTELDLELQLQLSDDWKLVASGRGFYDFAYLIKGHSQFTPEVLDVYEYEIYLTDTYVQGRLLSSLDLKIGRQIVVWGKSDNLRVTDVLNPLDNREPGLVDIEDLRLPVTMIRMDYYLRDWNLTALVIPEIRFGKDPVYGSDFFPMDQSPPPEKTPASKPANYEYGLALNGVFSGWDLSLYAARFFEDQYHLKWSMNGPGFPYELQHNELYMGGVAVNFALGNWLLKSEVAYLDGFEFNAASDKKSRLDLLVGLEYSGFTDTTLSLEVVNRHLFDFEPGMTKDLPKNMPIPASMDTPDLAQEDSFQAAARITRNFFHETLQVTLLGSILGEKAQDGAFERISAKYDVTDALAVSGGIVLYQKGDLLFFQNIEQNDRLFLDIKYSF